MEQHGERYPNQLSGGQQQRVALARAIAAEPRTLLFDEPLSNLDAVLREQMRFEIRALQQRLGMTAVYVTHSQEEALALSDTIAVMFDGRIVQSGTPTDIYNQPRTEFVATFIGLSNILVLHKVERHARVLRGVLKGGVVVRAAGGAVGGTLHGEPVKLSVRPVDIRIASACIPEGTPGLNRLPGTVRLTIFTGGLVDYFVELDSDPETVLRVQSTPPAAAAQGDHVVLAFEPARTVALES
jgi:ABC-type Fe3+/spermidine/putrescine transport system ATPase subunit